MTLIGSTLCGLKQDCMDYGKSSWYVRSSGTCFTYDPDTLIAVTDSSQPAIDYCEQNLPGVLLRVSFLCWTNFTSFII